MKDYVYPEEMRNSHFERLLRQMHKDQKVVDDFLKRLIERRKEDNDANRTGKITKSND